MYDMGRGEVWEHLGKVLGGRIHLSRRGGLRLIMNPPTRTTIKRTSIQVVRTRGEEGSRQSPLRERGEEGGHF